ncbi:MAG: hypothetical protein KDK66_08605 [Deltaproteobacteria bacterium]|nr:hypothetical protein [Deltaproteobacteria bacterium]
MAWKKYLFLSLILLGLSACGQEVLHENLTERQANEISYILHEHHIEAKKVRSESSQEVTYSVEVKKEDYAEARKLMVLFNLPKVEKIGFKELCKETGLIPTAQEAKCRTLLALKGEIVNSLESIPGVIEANVVLSIPEKKSFDDPSAEEPRPTASAVIKLNRDLMDSELKESHFQRFIANAVENLDPLSVSVVLTYQDTIRPESEDPDSKAVASPEASRDSGEPMAVAGLSTVAGLELSEASVKRFKIYAVVFLVVLMAVSGVLIINVLKMTKLRQELKVAKGLGMSEAAALLDSPKGPAAAPALPEAMGEEEPAPETSSQEGS